MGIEKRSVAAALLAALPALFVGLIGRLIVGMRCAEETEPGSRAADICSAYDVVPWILPVIVPPLLAVGLALAVWSRSRQLFGAALITGATVIYHAVLFAL